MSEYNVHEHHNEVVKELQDYLGQAMSALENFQSCIAEYEGLLSPIPHIYEVSLTIGNVLDDLYQVSPDCVGDNLCGWCGEGVDRLFDDDYGDKICLDCLVRISKGKWGE